MLPQADGCRADAPVGPGLLCPRHPSARDEQEVAFSPPGTTQPWPLDAEALSGPAWTCPAHLVSFRGCRVCECLHELLSRGREGRRASAAQAGGDPWASQGSGRGLCRHRSARWRSGCACLLVATAPPPVHSCLALVSHVVWQLWVCFLQFCMWSQCHWAQARFPPHLALNTTTRMPSVCRGGCRFPAIRGHPWPAVLSGPGLGPSPPSSAPAPASQSSWLSPGCRLRGWQCCHLPPAALCSAASLG